MAWGVLALVDHCDRIRVEHTLRFLNLEALGFSADPRLKFKVQSRSLPDSP
jgi:hypothetical protein